MPQSDAHDDPLVGSVVDSRYRVMRRIGQGGIGTVYEVEHTRIGRRLALKTLYSSFANNPKLVARFQREARAAGAIGDEHIIEVSDFGQLPGGEPYLVMELLQGHDLSTELARGGPLSVQRAVDIALQACQGLGAAHAQGIIHRDLKPENVFLVSRRQQRDFVKLVDFGTSKIKSAPIAAGHSVTHTGMLLGTPCYMAPEQIEGSREIDARTDVYAVGVLLFETLTGRLPFEARSFAVLVVQITEKTPPSMCELRPEVPPALDAVVQRALAKRPGDRFDSMDALASALRPLVEERGR